MENLQMRDYAIASSISAIAMSDLDGNLTYVNPAFLRIWGYDNDTEVLGKSVNEFWQTPECANEVIQALGEQGEWFGELVGKRKDGSSFNTEVAAYMILDKVNNPVGMAASFLDITKRKRAEEALCQARKEWEEIFQAIGHPTLILDKEHRILAANRATLKAAGLTEEELATKKCFEIFHYSNQHLETCPLQKLLCSGHFETVEMEMEAFNSVFLVSCTPVVDENGNIQKIIHIATDITERRQAEKTLKASEARFRELFDNMSSGVAVYEAVEDGRDFIFKDFNQAGERIEKVKKGDLIGKSVVQMFPGVKEFGLFEVFQRVWRTGKPKHHPISLYKDKRIVGWRENDVYKLPSGEIVAVYDDITERKRTEEELEKHREHLEELIQARTTELQEANLQLAREIEKRKRVEEELRKFKTISDKANYGTAISDLKGRLIYVNKTFAEMHGYTPKELLGKPLSVCHNEEQLTRVNQLLHILKQEGSFSAEEVWHTKKDLSVFPALMNASVITDEEGIPMFLSATAVDITEHKRAEEVSAIQSRILENMVEGVNLSDEHANILFTNPAFDEMFGYERGELNGKHVSVLNAYSAEENVQLVNEIIEHLKTGGIWKGEFKNKKKDGTHFTTYGSISTLEISGKQYWISVQEDITDRKRAEEELQKAKETAESANRAKSEFLANMSHELRTPLNAILGYAQILSRDEGLKDKHREQVGIIYRSGDHLLAMISEILDLAKIEARRVELEPANFHLPGLLKSIADMIQIRAYYKGLTFRAEIASNLPSVVYGDEKRLRQILINLLSNAVKFTEEGSVTLRVMAKGERRKAKGENPQENALCQIRFQVEDTGIGIPSEKLDNIFLPFEQVSERHLYSEGTGLGLAISQTLVRMMGSELRVTSSVDKGSTFWFDLDLPEVEGEVKPTTPEARRIVGFKGPSIATSTDAFSPELVKGSGQGSGRATCKILIADDNDENRTVVKDMLLPLGFEIIEAIDGHDALDKANACHPDVILMDLMMPELDGFEATRRIRELEQPATSIQHPVSSIWHPIIIAVSASVFNRTQEKSVVAGCDDFISKPISKKILLSKLQTHLNIEWIYDDTISDFGVEISDVQSPQSTIHNPQSTIIPPPMEELSRLNEMALIGDIMGIRACVEKIDNGAPQFAQFAAKMRKLAKELKLLEIQDFLKQYVET